MSRRSAALVVATLLLAGCTTTTTTTTTVETVGMSGRPSCGPSMADADFPAVLEAVVEPGGGGLVVTATLCSPYDGPDRYADGWRVLLPDGTTVAQRELSHHHAGEQPFTRSLLEPLPLLPEGTTELVVEGRDSVNGWGGETYTITLP